MTASIILVGTKAVRNDNPGRGNKESFKRFVSCTVVDGLVKARTTLAQTDKTISSQSLSFLHAIQRQDALNRGFLFLAAEAFPSEKAEENLKERPKEKS